MVAQHSVYVIQTKVDDIEWSHSRRVDCVSCTCRYIHHLITYIADLHSLSFKTRVNDTEWSHSRRVDCVLCR